MRFAYSNQSWGPPWCLQLSFFPGNFLGTNAWTAQRSPFAFAMLLISTELGNFSSADSIAGCPECAIETFPCLAVKCFGFSSLSSFWSTFLTAKSFLCSPPWMSRLKWLALIVGLGLIEPSALFIKLFPYRQYTMLYQSLASPWEWHTGLYFQEALWTGASCHLMSTQGAAFIPATCGENHASTLSFNM